jgi:hypothetical protein
MPSPPFDSDTQIGNADLRLTPVPLPGSLVLAVSGVLILLLLTYRRPAASVSQCHLASSRDC